MDNLNAKNLLQELKKENSLLLKNVNVTVRKNNITELTLTIVDEHNKLTKKICSPPAIWNKTNLYLEEDVELLLDKLAEKGGLKSSFWEMLDRVTDENERLKEEIKELKKKNGIR